MYSVLFMYMGETVCIICVMTDKAGRDFAFRPPATPLFYHLPLLARPYHLHPPPPPLPLLALPRSEAVPGLKLSSPRPETGTLSAEQDDVLNSKTEGRF